MQQRRSQQPTFGQHPLICLPPQARMADVFKRHSWFVASRNELNAQRLENVVISIVTAVKSIRLSLSPQGRQHRRSPVAPVSLRGAVTSATVQTWSRVSKLS